jgi:hypothetical protein
MQSRYECRILANMKKLIPDSQNQVRLWRRLVREIRRVAANLGPGPARDMMLGTANDYELMADDMELRLQRAPATHDHSPEISYYLA